LSDFLQLARVGEKGAGRRRIGSGMSDAIDLREAQLYRILMRVFGRERIVPQARISFVCSGNLPELCPETNPGYRDWAEGFRCLFTLVNNEDEPRLVVEFRSDFTETVDIREVERDRYLPEVLQRQGIHYMTVSEAEFGELLSAESEMCFLHLMECKFGDKIVA
jgi:hypothetical protein